MSKVYKRFLFIATLFFLSLSANSNPVDIDTAREIGMKFLNANTKTPLRSVQELCLIATYNTNRGEAAFYVFNSSNGFIIVSADDRATPILGYSEEGPFDPNDVPIQMQDYLQDFSEQIQYGIDNQMEAYDKVRQQWETIEMIGKKYENRDVSTVGPLLTDTWNQNCYYNSLCPEDSLGPCGHVYAGCVATSMGQIMRYWEYPISGMGSYTNNSSGYPPQYANFAETQYDWVNMPDKLTDESTPDQVNAVATLLWHCGIAAKAQYGPYETSAFCPPLWFKQYFGYSTDLHGEYRNQYVDDEWISMLKDCLDLGRPIQYNGWQEGASVGHAFVCDGYDENEMFHFNWGWSGNGNGFYSLDAMIGNYNTRHCAVLDIHPLCDPEAEYIVSVAQTPMEGGTASGSGSYYCIESCTLTATPNDGYTFLYWTENDSIISRDTVYSIYVSENRSFVAHFGHRFTVESVPEIGGILSFSNTIPIYGDHDYQRIESAAELLPGDRVVLSAHCNPNNLNNYVAKKALRSGTGSYSVTPFTSETNGSIEMLPDTIKNNIENYYWILNITADANYEFNNCIQEAYSVPVNLNDYASIFTITEGISDPDAWIPNQHGLVISTPGSNKRLCYLHDFFYSSIDLSGFSLWNYDNQEKYVGILDLFTQHADAYTANNNDTVTLLALPNPRYHFVNWTKDGIEYSTNHSISFINTEACHYAANFELNTHEITVLAEPNTGGIVIGSNTYIEGDTCTITATPNQGYAFINWKRNGVVVSSLPTYSFVVNEPMCYSATFVPYSQTQVDNLSEGWNWWSPTVKTSLNTLQIALGSNLLEIKPQNGVLDTIVSGQMYKILTTAACQLHLTGPLSTLVEINIAPGHNWFGYIGAEMTINEALSSISPAVGDIIISQKEGFCIYNDNSWHGTLENLKTGHGYDFLSRDTVTKTMTFNASIPDLTITVTSNNADGGSVTGGGIYNYGDFCTVVASSYEGYDFTCWKENGVLVSNDTSYLFSVMDNRELEAQFLIRNYTITATASSTMGGSITGGGIYQYGQSCTLTATSYEGYDFVQWTENGVPVSTDAEYMFTVTGNRNLEALFQIQSYTIAVSINPTTGGTVLGCGTYDYGQTCIITAYPAVYHNFINWTENGNVVSTQASYSFIVTCNRTLEASFEYIPPEHIGVINGLFSVSPSKQVYFSKGNLQYIGSASTPYWKFAENQWDFLGSSTGQNSNSQTVDRDLFGWGTSGYNHGAIAYQPYSTSASNSHYYAYGEYTNNLFDLTGQADWGHNPVSNGGNTENLWRTLTREEWLYVFNSRNTPSSIRYAKAQVNEVNGVILLPDDWNEEYYSLEQTNTIDAGFSSNVISASKWTDFFESHGAVFLPAGGYRIGTRLVVEGSQGCYYSSSYNNINNAYRVFFSDVGLTQAVSTPRSYGYSVRLVQDY